MLGSKTFRWKGKIVIKDVYEARIRTMKVGKRNKGRKVVEQLIQNDAEKIEENVDDINKERIVSLKLLGSQLWCSSCKETLSLENIESERRQGFGSTFSVRCHKCLLINEVITGEQRVSPGKRQASRFERNFTAVIAAVHCGIGWTQLNKFCSVMNISCPNKNTFKRYEQEIGLAAENAKKSLKDVKNIEKIL